jgi:hypothetical protein
MATATVWLSWRLRHKSLISATVTVFTSLWASQTLARSLSSIPLKSKIVRPALCKVVSTASCGILPTGDLWPETDINTTRVIRLNYTPSKVFSNQLVSPATSSSADDVHHYVIPPKLLLTNRVYFQQPSGIHAPVGKRKGGSLSGGSPAPIAEF